MLFRSSWKSTRVRLNPVVLVPVSLPESLRVPRGDLAMSVRIDETPASSLFMTAAVTISVDGRDYQTLPLTFRVGRYQPVVVATHALEPGRVLVASDVRLERRPSTDAPPDALEELGPLGQLEATRSVRAGEILTPRAVQRRLLVRRGEMVTLVLEGRGFRITAQGQVKQDARLGDTVRVLNVTSQHEVLGQVEGSGMVRVPFMQTGSE